MTSPPNITQITPPRVPLIDPRTNLVSREWYRFFLNLYSKTSGSSFSLEDLQLGPDTVTDLTQIDQAVQALAVTTNTLQAQVATLANDVQAQALAPPATPQVKQRRYGSFYDTTTQTAAAINTAYAMTLNTTSLSSGVYTGSPTSRVYVDRNGVYNIQFSAQLDNTGGTDKLIWIWLRVNGADVAYSASQTRLKGNDAELVAAWNFLHEFKAGDYFELMWSTDDTGVRIVAAAAAAPVPAIPSVILTVTDNISAYQD